VATNLEVVGRDAVTRPDRIGRLAAEIARFNELGVFGLQ